MTQVTRLSQQPDSKDLISSGDPVQDKEAIDAFVARYEVMRRWRRMPDDRQVLLVGSDNFPFPIPLKKNSNGKWYFDTAAGREEILNRRIGRNGLDVIGICRAVAQAQAEYYSQTHDGAKTKQYALKFISDPGKHNGLYWQSAEGQPQSPLGPMAAYATAEGYAVKRLATAMTESDPDEGWKIVEEWPIFELLPFRQGATVTVSQPTLQNRPLLDKLGIPRAGFRAFRHMHTTIAA